MVDEVAIVASGLRFPEGPALLPDGRVLVCEMARGSLSVVDPGAGTVEVVAMLGGSPNGVALGTDGAAYVCNSGGLGVAEVDGRLYPAALPEHEPGRIERVDLDAGGQTTLYTACDGHPLIAPNDIAIDADGWLWFTDSGRRRARSRDWGGIYRAAPDGSRIEEVRYLLSEPNGIGFSPDGRVLYVAETGPARLWGWDVVGPGELRSDDGGRPSIGQGARMVHAAPTNQIYDSLAVAADGTVVVATVGRPGGLTIIDPSNGSATFLPLDERYVTNLCFSGEGAFVTLASRGELAWVPTVPRAVTGAPIA